jgi:hypothetical protein
MIQRLIVYSRITILVPKKIGELKSMLLKAGFSYRSGKDGHTV